MLCTLDSCCVIFVEDSKPSINEARDPEVAELGIEDDEKGTMSVADDSEKAGGALEGRENVRWGVPMKRDRAGWGRAEEEATEAVSSLAASDRLARAEDEDAAVAAAAAAEEEVWEEKEVLAKSRWFR